MVDVVVGPLVGVIMLPVSWWALTSAWQQRAGPVADDGAVVIGLLLGVLLLGWRKPNLLLHTWLHETAHALMCVLLWVRIGAIEASAGQGGAVRHARVGAVRTTAILIAPYILPLLAGPVLLARYLCEPGWMRLGLSAGCGLALVLHLSDLWLNVRLNAFGQDADIPRVGHLLACVLICASLVLLAAAAVVVLHSQQPPDWWRGLFAA
jgi:hypothetical protein